MATKLATAQAAGYSLGLVADVNGSGSSIFLTHSGSANANNYVARIDVDGSYNIIGGASYGPGGSTSQPFLTLNGTSTVIPVSGQVTISTDGGSTKVNYNAYGASAGHYFYSGAGAYWGTITGGRITATNDMCAYRSPTAGYTFYGSNATSYWGFDGTQYVNNGAQINVGTVLSSGSISSISSTAKLLIAADPGGQNYIESGNAAFNGSVPLNICGYNASQGTTLILNMASTVATGSMAVNSAGIGYATAALSVPNGDIYTARNNNTGALFLGNSGAHYLYFDGSQYIFSASQLTVANAGIVAAGNITGTSFTANGGGIVFNAPSATTGYCYASIGNNLSSLIWGVGSNTGNGGLFYGGLPYYGVIGTSLNYGFQIATNNTVRFTIDNVGNTTHTGTTHTYSGSAFYYGATTIRGNVNGWGGLQFQDTAANNLGCLMVQAGVGGGIMGFYNAPSTGWMFQVSQAGAGTFSSTCTATGFYVASSRALKQDIHPIDFDALKAITQTDIVYYRYKDGPDQDVKLGFIAEDTPAELVGTEPRFDTNRVLAASLHAIKQLSQRLDTLERKD